MCKSDGTKYKINKILNQISYYHSDYKMNKIYDVVEQDDEYYRIVDDTDEDYLYPKSMFEVI